jgi:hypothetical protein
VIFLVGRALCRYDLPDPKLPITFADGKNSWLMNAIWDGNSSRKLNADEVREEAVLCHPGRRLWTDKIVSATISSQRVKPFSRCGK